MRRVFATAVVLITLLMPLAGSVPGTLVLGYVDDATTCSPELGGGCVVWATQVPDNAVAYRYDVQGGRAIVLWSEPDQSYRVRVTAYDAIYGIELWSTLLPDAHPRDVAISEDGSRIYVVAESGAVVVALDAASGAVLWTSYFNSTYIVHAVAPLPGGALAVLVERDFRPRLVGVLDAADGHLAWGAFAGDETATRLAATPDGATLLVGGDTIAAFSVASHQVVWRTRVATAATQTNLLHVDASLGQLEVHAIAAETPRIAALDLATGATRWSAVVTGTWGFARSGDLIVASARGGAVAYDAATGARQWTTAQEPDALTEAASTCHEIDANAELVLLRCPLGLHAIDAATGERLWTRPGAMYAPRLDASSPWGYVFHDTSPGNLLALDPRLGVVSGAISDG